MLLGLFILVCVLLCVATNALTAASFLLDEQLPKVTDI